MDEEKVWEINLNSRSEANPGDQYSPDFGSEDSFLTPDSYSSLSSSGRKNFDIFPNVDSNRSSSSSSSGRKNIDIFPNVDSNRSSSSSGRKNIDVSPNVDSNRSSSSSGHKNIDVSPNVDSHRSSSFSSSGRKNIDVSPNLDSNKQLEKYGSNAGQIDTARPIGSVKEAVSRFGVIADWKAHRHQTNERRKFIEQELEKAHEEIPIFKQKSELAEQAKQRALKDLYSTKRLILELKLNLERAQTEERQAKQDSELAQLRLQELEQGITDESSVAAKTQLEVAKARHQEATSDLITAKNELEETRKDYEVLILERDSAVEKAREAVSAAKELEGEVENLTIQLITTKEAIETIHALHLEVEEQRIHEINERDLVLLNLDHELRQAEEEMENVKQQVLLAEDLKSKYEAASRLLRRLKDELAVYMQGKILEEEDDKNFTRKHVQSGVAIAKKNRDEVNHEIERTKEEIMSLKTAAKSLTAKLEGEKQVLANIRQQKGLGAEAVVNIDSELKRARLELDDTRRKEKEAREKLVELPKQLQKAREETQEAKLLAEGASLVLAKAKKHVEEAKNEVSSLRSKLAKIEKEIEAARAQEKLALGAISALHESESARCTKKEDLKGGITITLEEYYELSKRAHEAEEEASKRVAEATTEVNEAKESEMQSLNKLTQLNSELAAQKEALNVALQKAEMVKESRADIEEELKRRNGEMCEDESLSQKTKPDSASLKLVPSSSLKKGSLASSSLKIGSLKKADSTKKAGSTTEGKGNLVRGLFKKKRSFMPKLSFVFMGKKKSTSNKSTTS
ncbi:hypothetical protein QVD17_16097 [Tagetes erecta]|uniref:Uncharacterized protein n=1 Tax=Tagetes erecta TaxID=13708 RepID=A0AAD8P082_TARER|nr:hypothetical protein QVD17_16097 [Tagetes erecta]